MVTKKTNELKGAAKDRAKKVYGGEKKGLSKKLSDFVSGVKKRKAEADQKASDKAKAKKTATTAKKKPTAVPGTMKGKQVDTTKGPNYAKPKRKSTADKTSVVNKKTTGMQSEKIGPNMSRGTKAKTTMSANKSTMSPKQSAQRKAAGEATVAKKKKKAGPSGPTMTSFK